MRLRWRDEFCEKEEFDGAVPGLPAVCLFPNTVLLIGRLRRHVTSSAAFARLVLSPSSPASNHRSAIPGLPDMFPMPSEAISSGTGLS